MCGLTGVCFCLCLSQVLLTDIKVLQVMMKKVLDPEFVFSDQICSILSNLTRHLKTCKIMFKVC